MDKCITTTIRVSYCANHNKIQIKCNFTPKQRVTRNKIALLKRFEDVYLRSFFHQIPSKYDRIMTIHVDITDIILVNFGPHFRFWQLKNSLCKTCHALGKIKGAFENKIHELHKFNE